MDRKHVLSPLGKSLSISLCLLIVLVGSAFAGGRAEATKPSETKFWSEPGVFPIVDQPMEFDFFAAYFAGFVPLSENTQLKIYEDMTNIRINWIESAEADHQTKFALSLASGSYPDAYFNMTTTPSQLYIYGKQGVLIPLNDAIEAQGINIKARYEQHPEILRASIAPDGNIYSLFQYDPALHMLTQQKMFVNAEWVEKSGLGMPETLDEFTALLEYFRDNDMNGNGRADDEIPLVSRAGWNESAFLMNSFIHYPTRHGGLDVENGKVFPVFTRDEYRDGLRYMRSLYDNGLLGSESFTQDAAALSALVNRPDEMIVGAVGTTFFQGFFLRVPEHERGFETYVAVPPLVGPAGVAQTPLTNDGVTITRSIQITQRAKYPEILIKWIDYFYGDEGAMWAMVGTEGQEYEWVDRPAIDGTIPSFVRDPFFRTPPISTYIQNQGPMYWPNRFRYGETAEPGGTTLVVHDESQMYLKFVDFDRERLPQTIWMDEEQSRILSRLQSTITDYVNESRAKFIVGELDLDRDWNAYLATLEAMGIKTYIELYQQVFDVSR